MLPKEKLCHRMIHATRQSTKSCGIQLINNNIKTSKASYYSNACSQSKGNSRKTWQTINELTSRRTNNTKKKVNLNRFQKTKEKIYSSTQYPV